MPNNLVDNWWKLSKADFDWSDFFVLTSLDLLESQHVKILLTLQDGSFEYSQTEQFLNFTLLYDDRTKSDEKSIYFPDMINGQEVTLENTRTGNVKVIKYWWRNGNNILYSDSYHWLT